MAFPTWALPGDPLPPPPPGGGVQSWAFKEAAGPPPFGASLSDVRGRGLRVGERRAGKGKRWRLAPGQLLGWTPSPPSGGGEGVPAASGKVLIPMPLEAPVTTAHCAPYLGDGGGAASWLGGGQGRGGLRSRTATLGFGGGLSSRVGSPHSLHSTPTELLVGLDGVGISPPPSPPGKELTVNHSF